MNSNSLLKQLGCIMMIIGTEVGAGILALPIISAKLGFITASIIMIIAWAVMFYTSILIADICLHMPKGTSFSSMAKRLLGMPGAIVSWLSFVVLLYAISIAYISAASSAFHELIPFFHKNIWAFIFVFIFATFVIMGVRAVDWVNRLLLSMKLIFLISVCLIMMSLVNASNLLIKPMDLGILVLAVPIIVTSFTSHLIVPTLTDYLNKDAKVIYRVLLIGSIIPLILYFIWLIAILGVLPLHGSVSFMSLVFDHKSIESANIGDVLFALQQKVNMQSISFGIDTFTDISVMTSYLSVSLALYHFNVDSYRLKKLSFRYQTLIALILTFAIPLLVVQINPDLFVPALSYVGVCVAVLLIIMPVIMAYRLHSNKQPFHYQLSKIKLFWGLALLAGISIIGIKILAYYIHL